MSVENNSIDSVSSKNLLNIPSKSASMLETERTVFSKDTTIVAKSEHYNTDIRIPSFNKRNSASNNLHSNYLENLKCKSTKDAKKIKRNILKINEIKESNPSNSKTMKNEEFKVIINHSPSKQFEIKRKSCFNEVDTFKEFPKFKRMTTTFADMRIPHSEKCGPNCRHLLKEEIHQLHIPKGTYVLKQKEHIFDVE